MKSLRLVQFTDTHISGDTNNRLRGVATLHALQAAVEHAGERLREADAILLTGDLVQDDPAGYPFIRKVFERSHVPVYCLPGNHDLPEHMRIVLAGPPFQVGGVVRNGCWIIVLLDTWLEHSAGGRLGAVELRRLEHVLAEHEDAHALLCLHHQPIPMLSRWLDEVGLEDASELLEVVARHDNVRGVLWGHVHQALDTFVGRVRFMSTPSTCTQFRPRDDSFGIDARPPGYRVLDLAADGSIATEVVWLEGYLP